MRVKLSTKSRQRMVMWMMISIFEKYILTFEYNLCVLIDRKSSGKQDLCVGCNFFSKKKFINDGHQCAASRRDQETHSLRVAHPIYQPEQI